MHVACFQGCPVMFYSVTSILAFQYYGQTAVPKYFHELAEMQNVLGFAFVPQYMFSDAKVVCSSTAYTECSFGMLGSETNTVLGHGLKSTVS